MKLFEYHVEPLSPSSKADMMETLNDLGSDGWQLVTVINRVGYFMREMNPRRFDPSQGVANG